MWEERTSGQLVAKENITWIRSNTVQFNYVEVQLVFLSACQSNNMEVGVGSVIWTRHWLIFSYYLIHCSNFSVVWERSDWQCIFRSAWMQTCIADKHTRKMQLSLTACRLSLLRADGTVVFVTVALRCSVSLRAPWLGSANYLEVWVQLKVAVTPGLRQQAPLVFMPGLQSAINVTNAHKHLSLTNAYSISLCIPIVVHCTVTVHINFIVLLVNSNRVWDERNRTFLQGLYLPKSMAKNKQTDARLVDFSYA